MLNISVKLDVRAMKREFAKEHRKIEQAAARAINRAAEGGATAAARDISAKTKLKVREIRKRMTIRRARPGYLIAEIHAHPYAPNLKAFRPTQNAKGTAASAWERRKTYMHAFIHPRTGSVVTRTTNSRFPLKGLYGPSLPKTFIRADVLAEIEKVVLERFNKEFEREISRRLGR